MQSDEAKKFLEQLQNLFGSAGEEVSRTPSRLPQRPRDVISVYLKFYTPIGQVFEICFNTQRRRVTIVIIPPFGDLIHVTRWKQAEWALTQIRSFLDLEKATFKKPVFKVLA